MRSRYFHPEWGNLAPASTRVRTAGIALVAMAIGTVAGVCVMVSLITASGVGSSISAHDTVFTAASAVRPPATSAGLSISLPASVDRFPQPAPAGPSGSQKSAPAIAVPEAIHAEARAPVEHASTKMRVTKKHYARNRWRSDDRIRQHLGLIERLKPQ